MRKKIASFFFKYRSKAFFSTALLSCFFVQLIATPIILAETVEERVFTQKDELSRKEVSNYSGVKDELRDKNTVVIPEKTPFKDPRLACILSFIVPGAGEIYLRKDIKGITFCLSTSTAYVLSFYFLYLGFIQSGSSGKSKLIAGGVGAVAALVLHIVGMVESYNDAIEINEARYYFSE